MKHTEGRKRLSKGSREMDEKYPALFRIIADTDGDNVNKRKAVKRMEYIKNVTEVGSTINETFITTDTRKSAMIRVALEEYREKLYEIDASDDLKKIADELVEITKLENAKVKKVKL